MKVMIILGSESDLPVMKGCLETLEEFGIPSEIRILSAHRSLHALIVAVALAQEEGTALFIAAASLNASLAGVVAGLTVRPVISVPLAGGALNGLDSLLASSQMPTGVPVATMTIGAVGAVNAAIFAVQLLALADSELTERLKRRLKR
jgi:5-(carboxyamino)imidazole ribonucleotide mutase